MSAETMLQLANSYQEGITIISSVVCALYIALSVFVVVKARKQGLNVCMLGFVPVYQVTIIPIRVLLLKGKRRKQKLAKSAPKTVEKTFEDFEENEEIEL